MLLKGAAWFMPFHSKMPLPDPEERKKKLGPVLDQEA
jgi:hypothetical protein